MESGLSNFAFLSLSRTSCVFFGGEAKLGSTGIEMETEILPLFWNPFSVAFLVERVTWKAPHALENFVKNSVPLSPREKGACQRVQKKRQKISLGGRAQNTHDIVHTAAAAKEEEEEK